MDLHLRGKRVLITGASKGIGAAAAEAFAEEGCHLLLAARNGDQLKALAERLRSAHQIDAATSIVDLRRSEDLTRLAKEAADIDVLVNNAGDIPGGSIDKIELPRPGQWIRQGQKICTLHRDGSAVDVVSPIEGSVADINEAVNKDAKLALRDPYGEGWLVTVQAPDSKLNFRNLLSGTLARLWTEDSALRLRSRMPTFAGALAQDGGVAVDDLSAHMPAEDWAKVSKEFFLS